MAESVFTAYEGFIKLPIQVKDRNGGTMSLVSTRVVSVDAVPSGSDPSWFQYTATFIEEVDGTSRLDIDYKFLASATSPGLYVIEYVVNNGLTNYTRTFDVDIPAMSPGIASPAVVADLVFWSRGSSIFGLEHGDAISELPNLAVDVITNPEDLSQDVTDNKPTIQEGLGTNDAIQFDTDDNFRLTKSFGGEKTLFILAKTLNNIGNIVTGSNAGRPRLYTGFDTITSYKTGGVATLTNYIGIENKDLDTNPGLTDTSVIPFDAAADYNLYTVKFTPTFASYWVNGIFQGFTSGDGGTTDWFEFVDTAGWMTEIAVYNRALEDSEIATIHSYFNAAYPTLTINADPQFTPGDISDIQAWYNGVAPDQQTNVELGNVIESFFILDRSGFATTLSRDVGTCSGLCTPPGTQPQLSLGGLNGENIYQFTDGEFLEAPSFAGPGANTTIFIVARITGSILVTDEKYIFDGGSSGNRLSFGYVDSKLFIFRGGTRRDSADIAGADSDYKIFRIEFNPVATNDELYVNGVQVIDADSGGETLTDGFVLGSRFDAAYGTADSAQYGASFNFAELIVYNKILTTDEAYSVENYLAAKYRLPLN